MNLLYSKKSVQETISNIFDILFSDATRPTRELLVNFLIGHLATEGSASVKKLYSRVLSKMSGRCLNSYYHALANERISDRSICRQIIQLACGLIPKSLRKEPVFLAVDDTTIQKSGKHFDNVGTLYDHSVHDGNHFINGHCFVSLVLTVPIFTMQHGILKNIRYLPIPIGYRMWDGSATKLEMADSMIREVLPALGDREIILSFDSWYAKHDLICSILQHENVHIICNARSDTAMYDLPPVPAGRRGRPAKRGAQLSLEDFEYTETVGKYSVAHRKVKTKIFGDRVVDAYVTVSKTGIHKVFFSTISPADISMSCAWQEKEQLRKVSAKDVEFLPLMLYSERWNIEKSYYAQKMFWSLGKYMVRRKTAIEHMLNLINAAYSMTIMLPYLYEDFAGFQDCSPQEFRHYLSDRIRQGLFLEGLCRNANLNKNQTELVNRFKNLLWRLYAAA